MQEIDTIKEILKPYKMVSLVYYERVCGQKDKYNLKLLVNDFVIRSTLIKKIEKQTQLELNSIWTIDNNTLTLVFFTKVEE